ncbi:MAG: hypothetical protein DRK00_03370, partial [Thermoprotei archaeon]
MLLGAGALSLLGPELSSLDVESVLLLYGEGLSCLAERVVEGLGGVRVRCVEVEDRHLPPKVEAVRRLGKLLEAHDFVVAVG